MSAPLKGALLGFLSGLIYWLGVHLWPASVALIMAMTATAFLPKWTSPSAAARFAGLPVVLLLLVKFNALLALSAAPLPFATPPNVSLILIMVCGYACSFALRTSVMAARPQASAPKIGSAALGGTMLIGFAPAALLGIPGLIGVCGAIIVAIGIIAVLRHQRAEGAGDTLHLTQLSTEACFYLSALAAWRYV